MLPHGYSVYLTLYSLSTWFVWSFLSIVANQVFVQSFVSLIRLLLLTLDRSSLVHHRTTATDLEFSCVPCFQSPNFSHITPLQCSLHWLRIAAPIRFKTLMLTKKTEQVPTTWQHQLNLRCTTFSLKHKLDSVKPQETRKTYIKTGTNVVERTSLDSPNRCFHTKIKKQLLYLPAKLKGIYS